MFLVFRFLYFLYKFVVLRTRGGDKKSFFHHFFCVYTQLITMTKTENRDFVFIFSGIGLSNNLIMVNCSEFISLTMKFYLLLSAQISGRLARCSIDFDPSISFILRFWAADPKGTRSYRTERSNFRAGSWRRAGAWRGPGVWGGPGVWRDETDVCSLVRSFARSLVRSFVRSDARKLPPSVL